MKVFWSWQSDRTQAVCRHFVREALEEAVKQVATDLNLDESERPEVDSDVEGAPGMADIVATILGKIEQSAIFVADLTPIARTDQGKVVSNPNVLLELGYAMRAIGPDQIVAVANTAWLKMRPEDLPFDIRHRRAPILYHLPKDASEDYKETTRNELIAALTKRISDCLKIAVKERDEASALSGSPSRASDPSVWFESGQTHVHRDWFGSGKTEVVMAEAPRAYMRIIPSGWTNTAPSRDQVHRAPDGTRLLPLGGAVVANGGMNSQGVIIYGSYASPPPTAAQWFMSTGEIWGFDNSIITKWNDDDKLLMFAALLKNWRDFLARGIRLLELTGARLPYRVEAGVVGLEGVKWPAQFKSDRLEALNDNASFSVKSRDWADAQQLAFVTQAYNSVREAFGLRKEDETRVLEILSS